MGAEKWSKNEKLTEDEVNDIVDFFYKDKGKELKKICNQILHTLEDCKKRIDKPHIAYVSREALRTFIREEFGND